MIKNRQQNFLLNQQISFCSVQYFGIPILTIYQRYDNGIYFDTGISIIPVNCPALSVSPNYMPFVVTNGLLRRLLGPGEVLMAPTLLK